jgi:hypothetical protein
MVASDKSRLPVILSGGRGSGGSEGSPRESCRMFSRLDGLMTFSTAVSRRGGRYQSAAWSFQPGFVDSMSATFPFQRLIVTSGSAHESRRNVTASVGILRSPSTRPPIAQDDRGDDLERSRFDPSLPPIPPPPLSIVRKNPSRKNCRWMSPSRIRSIVRFQTPSSSLDGLMS